MSRSLCIHCGGIGWLCRDAEGNLHRFDEKGVEGAAVACESCALAKSASGGARRAAAPRSGKKSSRKKSRHVPEPPAAPDRKTLSAGS